MKNLILFILLMISSLIIHGCYASTPVYWYDDLGCDVLSFNTGSSSHREIYEKIGACGSVRAVAIHGALWRSLPEMNGVAELVLTDHGPVDVQELCYIAPDLQLLSLGRSTSVADSLMVDGRICDGRVRVEIIRRN